MVAGRRLGREEAVQVTPKAQISSPAVPARQTSKSVGCPTRVQVQNAVKSV